jgi:hypothetical protein
MRSLCYVLILAILGLVIGCTSGPPAGETGRETAPAVKVPVEAYLFDVVIKRNGKPTSLRLDVFDADSVIALGGRAYLGKGALRARLTRDSLTAYFPTSDQYLEQSLSSFSMSGEKRVDLSEVGLLDILTKRPDTGQVNDSIRVDIIEESTGDSERAIHTGQLGYPSVTWSMTVKYWLDDDGQWRLSNLIYSDSTTKITANRREYRSHARISADRFRVAIPPTAVRVSP